MDGCALAIVMVVLVIVSIASSITGSVAVVIPIFFVLMCIKEIVQDFYVGAYKRKVNPIRAIFYFILETTRNIAYSYTVYKFSDRHTSTGGLRMFLTLFDFYFVLLVVGFVFLFLEVMTLYHTLGKDEMEASQTTIGLVIETVATGIFLAICGWC